MKIFFSLFTAWYPLRSIHSGICVLRVYPIYALEKHVRVSFQAGLRPSVQRSDVYNIVSHPHGHHDQYAHRQGVAYWFSSPCIRAQLQWQALVRGLEGWSVKIRFLNRSLHLSNFVYVFKFSGVITWKLETPRVLL